MASVESESKSCGARHLESERVEPAVRLRTSLMEVVAVETVEP